MKKSKFSDSQIMESLKRAEAGLAVPELCRELGISSATFYKWRAKYGGMDTGSSQLCIQRGICLTLTRPQVV
jgi:putative transposase